MAAAAEEADAAAPAQHSTAAAAAFVRLWRSGACDEAARTQLAGLVAGCPLSGRVIHGFPDQPGFDQPQLSADKWKRLSWVFGADALPRFLGKSAREICLQLGFGEEWLANKVAAGKHFKLAIFPASCADTQLATWDGVEALLRSAYPEVWTSKIAPHYGRIRSTSFEKLELEAGYEMLKVNLVGRHRHVPDTGESDDPRYISLQRLQRREGTCTEVRQFLWDEIGLKGLFRGDGRTEDDHGELGPLEYLCRNMPLAEMAGVVVVDLDLDIVPS